MKNYLLETEDEVEYMFGEDNGEVNPERDFFEAMIKDIKRDEPKNEGEILINKSTKKSISFKKPTANNCFLDKDTNTEYARVFGKWKCSGCNKSWYSAYTWISLHFGLNNKIMCKDIDLSSKSKIKKHIKVFSGQKMECKDFLIQECQKCLGDSKVRIINYSNLERNPNADYLDRDIAHNQDLCHKCKKGAFCNKRTFSTTSRPVTTTRNCIPLMNKRSFSTSEKRERFYRDGSENLLLNNLSSSYNIILDIINDSSMSAEEKQIKIEEVNRDGCKIDIINIISNKRSLGIDNKIGMEIVGRQLKLLDEDFNNLISSPSFNKSKSYMKIIKLIEPTSIVAIVISKIIPFAVKYKELDDQPITKLIFSVGEAILTEVRIQSYLKYSNSSSTGLEKNKVDFEQYIKLNDLNLSEDEITKIGLDFIHFFSSRSNFVELKEVYVKKESYRRYLIPKDNLNDLLENISITDSEQLPMLVKPLDWEIDNKGNIIKYGGTYFNRKYKFQNLISQAYKNPAAIETKFPEGFIKAINKLALNSYTLNKKVFEIITKKEYYIQDKFLQDEHIMEAFENKKLIQFKPHKESNILKNYIKDKNFLKINEITSYNSNYLYNTSILNIARLMVNVDEFYIPNFIDWRGRIYTSNSALNMQGGELARGLILFSKGEVLNSNGVRALKIYTANAYGLDKKSKDDRVKWVDEQIKNILDTPNNKLWLSAKEPILFLACALELIEFNKNPKFISRLPILLDATCNGIQHLSAIANDINLAEKVNILASNDENKPNDIYSDLIEPIKNTIQKMEGDERVKHFNLTKLNINRALIKRGIMTITYGVTVKGILDQLLSEHFYKYELVNNQYHYRPKNIELGDVKLTYKDIYKLSSIIYNTLFEIHPTLNRIMKYFQNMVVLMNGLNLAIQWITPYGLQITQKYSKFTKYDITSIMNGKRKKITLSKYDIDENNNHRLNKNKQINSFVPNFIHSMDASNVILLIQKAYNLNINIVTIHDCFGVHANHTELLSRLVKEAFISIYGDKKTIENFHDLNLNYIKANYEIKENKVINAEGKVLDIPVKPALGELDLKTQLINSNYFIN